MLQGPGERGEYAPDTVIERLVALACLAPSIHNTQPWLWQYDDKRLTLHADLRRQLHAEDPRGRNLTISCGAALQQLQFAAHALGWATTVTLRPVAHDATILAHVVVTRGEPTWISPADIELMRARCTDRRRFTAWPVPEDRLESLCHTAELWGVRTHSVIDDAERFRLELLSNRSLTDLQLDPARQHEQRTWVDRSDLTGIPHDLLTQREDPLHARSRFHPNLLEDTRLALHGSDRVIILGGDGDDVVDWLHTGQALSAVWFAALRDSLAVVPMSQPLENDSIRDELTRDVLGGTFRPHLLLRVGWQAMGRNELERTPRRPLHEVLRQPTP